MAGGRCRVGRAGVWWGVIDSPTNPAASRGPTLIQVLLLALPLGTVILGTFAMWWYFQRDVTYTPVAQPGLYQQDPNPDSLADRLSKLSNPVLARRGPGDADARRGLAAVSGFIEGSLGPGNMGYSVQSQSLPTGEMDLANLWGDALGRRNPTEIIEVRVPQDLPPDATVPSDNIPLAMALELANAFIGTENRRTVRFVFLANQSDPAPGTRTGGEAYSALMTDRRIKVLTVFDLGAEAARPIRSDGKIDLDAVLDRVESLRGAISSAANR